MRDCYVTEIGRLGTDASEGDRQHVDDRLSQYLVILYIEAALPDDVFEQFWNTAPVGSLQHAMWFLGIQLEQIPDNLRVRAISYWDRRLAAAKASATPDRFRQEIGSIGQFSFHKGIPGEWLMDQVLAVSEAGFAPSEPYSVMNRLVNLSPNFPDRAAEVLAGLVKKQHLDRWVYRGQSDGIRTIFRNGLSTGVPATATFVTEAINYLTTMGETGYLDLLPNPH